MKISEITALIETIAPCELAEEWDNVGLLIGKYDYEVNKVLVSLDINKDVLREAIENKVDLIITHHPVIFKPLKSINNDIYMDAIKNNISIYSCHTNLDMAAGGVNDVLVEKLHLSDVNSKGMMRIGKTDRMTLSSFVAALKKVLKTDGVRVCGDDGKIIEKVAVLGGSGGDFIYELNKSVCDVFVTGEASYHHAQYADENGFCLIAAGHYETENPVVEKIVKLLIENFDIEVLASNEKNVYNIR